MTLQFDRRYNQRDVPLIEESSDEDYILQPAGGEGDYDGAVLSESNLVAYLKMNETTGGTLADTLRMHDGILSGGYTVGEPGPPMGSKSVRLDGSSGYISLLDGPVPFDLSNGPWSLEAWIRRYNLTMTADQAIFGSTSSGPGGFLISAGSVVPVNSVSAFAGAYSGPYTEDPLTDINSWHHIVLTKWDDTWKIYIDKAEVVGTHVEVYTTDDGLRIIGNNPSFGNSFFNGWVTKVALYKKALSVESIEDHWLNGVTPPGW